MYIGIDQKQQVAKPSGVVENQNQIRLASGSSYAPRQYYHRVTLHYGVVTYKP